MSDEEPDEIGCAPVIIFPLCVLLCLCWGCPSVPTQGNAQTPTLAPVVAPELAAKLDTIIEAQGDVVNAVASSETAITTAITSAVSTSIQRQDTLESKVAQTAQNVGEMTSSVQKISYDLSANQLSLQSKRDWRLAVLGLIAFLIGVILPDPPKLYRLAMLGIVAVAALALILL